MPGCWGLNSLCANALQGNLKQVVRPLEENQELFGAVDLRGAELDFQAERDCLQRQQDAVDLGRADFSLSSPLYLNLFPVRYRRMEFAGQMHCHSAAECGFQFIASQMKQGMGGRYHGNGCVHVQALQGSPAPYAGISSIT